MMLRKRSPAEIMNVLRTFAMLLFVNILKTTGDCPRVCECKWKSGKESVLCINSNMTEIPKSLDSGTQLLDLTGNRLQEIGKDEFFNASLLNLQKIFMSRCKLRSMHRCSFRNIINLVELDLSHNELETIPSHTFEFITELRELKLNGNPIIRVLNYSFKTVPHLTKLDLSECEIIFVEVRAFQGLENSLEWLKLDKNYITNITPTALTHLGNLHGLELSNNPWNCTCRLRPLRQWMLRHNVPYGVSPVCRNPSRLAGKLWDKLEVDDFACPPKIEAVRAASHSEEGRNVTLTCSIDGVPEPKIHWVRRNQVIANLSGGMSAAGKSQKIYLVRVSNQTTNLTILGADAKDNGDYVCRAENKAGRAEASVTLAISAKPADKSWSVRMIMASAAVVLLFLIVTVLLVICACGTRRRKYLYRQPIVTQARLDSYEMNCKKPSTAGYDKIIKKEGGYGDGGDASEFSLVQGRQSKSGAGSYKVIGGDSDANEEDLSFGDSVSAMAYHQNRPWKSSDGEDRWSEFDSPDLHIPRLSRSERWRKSGQSEQAREEESKSGAAELLTSIPGVASHIMHKQQVSDSGGTLYTTAPRDGDGSSPPKYPDLLELNDKNLMNNNFCTLPRNGSHKVKRTRHVSCSSESQSPLLPGSSGDSYDSNFSINRRLSIESTFAKNSSLPTSPRNHTPTPILNLLENSAGYPVSSPTNFQYKSSELEKFLKEYRNLQEQLYKMKESCENLREENLKFSAGSRTVENNTISRLIDPSYSNAKAIEPLYSVTQHLLNDSANFDSVYNGNKVLHQEDNNNPKSILKSSEQKSLLDGLSAKNDSYWLSRQKLLTTLTESNPSDPFYKS
ncbi:UNVERIFIED_CONTAM: hypothetical protein PYX00_009828 [Menopon gallinae]|uniref:Ig-like domain-containing protein n=1 Tax=Menopon gallinae TaxID=328185 RepID=A0AAW2HCT7_9NEOP